jgi:hypothetical protein
MKTKTFRFAGNNGIAGKHPHCILCIEGRRGALRDDTSLTKVCLRWGFIPK